VELPYSFPPEGQSRQAVPIDLHALSNPMKPLADRAALLSASEEGNSMGIAACAHDADF
jgi:hypothetical protein